MRIEGGCRCSQLLALAGRQGVSEDKNHGVTTQEHLGDVTIFVHGFGLFLS